MPAVVKTRDLEYVTVVFAGTTRFGSDGKSTFAPCGSRAAITSLPIVTGLELLLRIVVLTVVGWPIAGLAGLKLMLLVISGLSSTCIERLLVVAVALL